MKKVLALLLAALALFSLAGCGVSKEARAVTELIEAIGEVTLESEPAIIAAEEAYAALSDEQKAEVEIADYLPIYRNNYEVLRHEADWEALKTRLVGDWYDLRESDEPAISIHEDGSAEIMDFPYTWTLNQNMETIRFEGGSRIVFEVVCDGELLALNNPNLMVCLKTEDFRDFRSKALYTTENIRGILGEAVDVGPLLDAEGNETGTRLFAFHSKAYDEGLVYFYCSYDFAFTYSVGRQFRGALYEPFGAADYNAKKVDLSKMSVSEPQGSVTFIRAEYVSEVRFDPETSTRTIVLTNGLELDASSGMNPRVDGVSYNAYAYLADPEFIF